MSQAGDTAKSAAQLPADAVRTAATEIKNVLELAKQTLDSATVGADTVVDEVATHVEAAYQSALALLHLAQNPKK